MIGWLVRILISDWLLLSRDKSSSKSQQWVAIVVAHELAHQWFGNLVSVSEDGDWLLELQTKIREDFKIKGHNRQASLRINANSVLIVS